MRRKVFIELPHTDSRFGDATVMEKLQKSMYGTRDAPQICAEAVQSSLNSIGYKQSCFQPAVYYHPAKSVIIVVHVDDFLCAGDPADLDETFEHLTKKFDLKKSAISLEDEREATCLNRTVRVSEEGVEIVGDPKHSKLLFKEWSICKFSKEVNAPSLKELEDKVAVGEELASGVAMKVRRGIARVNYKAQDRPDLPAVAKVMSQNMAKPSHLGPARRVPRPRRTCNVDRQWLGWRCGFSQVHKWWFCNTPRCCLIPLVQNGSQRCIAQCRGRVERYCEGAQWDGRLLQLHQRDFAGLTNRVDLLLSHRTGKVKQLSVKQLWAQEVVNHFGVQACKVHSVVGSMADVLLEGFNMKRLSNTNDEFCEWLAHDLRVKRRSSVRLKEDGLRFKSKLLILKARGDVDVPIVLSQFFSTLLTVSLLPHARAFLENSLTLCYYRMLWLTVLAGIGERRRADAT